MVKCPNCGADLAKRENGTFKCYTCGKCYKRKSQPQNGEASAVSDVYTTEPPVVATQPVAESVSAPTADNVSKELKAIPRNTTLRTLSMISLIIGIIFTILGLRSLINYISNAVTYGDSNWGSIVSLLIYLVIGIVLLVLGAVGVKRKTDTKWQAATRHRIRRVTAAIKRLDESDSKKDKLKAYEECVKRGDVEEFEKTTSYWEAQIDAYVAKVKREKGHVDVPIEKDGKGTFDGWLIQQIGWAILGSLITTITLGIGYPLAVVWMEKWRCKHTLYDGRRLSFDGKASQLVGSWICWLLLTLVTIGIFAFFIPRRVKKWKAKHTHIAGEYAEFGATFDGWLVQEILVNFVGAIITVCTLFIGYPIALKMHAKWMCKHTVIDGRRLFFDGTAAQIIGKYVLWMFLSVITFTIYIWFIPNRFKRWVASHTHVDNGYELH